MPGVLVSEYSPHSSAQFPTNNSSNKGTERLKQVNVIGECIFLKFVKGSNPIQYLVTAKLILSIYGVINISLYITILYTTESLFWNKSHQEWKLS